jgi:antitoxin CcdA
MRIYVAHMPTRLERTRKATNISLDTGLIDEARALNINISRACERGLAEQIREVRVQRWQQENAEALASSNAYVERKGLPLARFRQF